jgi:hypothetical protein
MSSIKMFLTRYLYLHVIKLNRIGIKRFRLIFFIRSGGREEGRLSLPIGGARSKKKLRGSMRTPQKYKQLLYYYAKLFTITY